MKQKVNYVKTISVAIVIILLISSIMITAHATTPFDFEPGEVIVGFRTHVDVSSLESFEGHNIIDKIVELNIALIEVEEGTEEEFIESIENHEDIYFAELNVYGSYCYEPNDEYWYRQWGPRQIDCPVAWDTELGSSDVVVAIVDSGVDYTHPDLCDNIWINPGEDLNDNGIVDASDFNDVDDDNNGYVDDIRGWDFIDNDNDPMDVEGHGTHCAGIVAAAINNNIGIAGVANVSIMPVSIPEMPVFSWSRGIMYAANNGADIISLSIGVLLSRITLRLACSYAYIVQEKLLVSSSGNDHLPLVGIPARYCTVIAVGATDQENERCSYSNYGLSLEVMAPGQHIYSTKIGGGYDYGSGTSFASPHVSGALSLYYSKYGDKPSQAREKLQSSATDIGDEYYYGHGLVNVSALLSSSGGGGGDGDGDGEGDDDSNSCFLAGTQITMADGSYKNIENVVVGDIVKSYDEANDVVIPGKVSETHSHTPENMTEYYVVINDEIYVTPNHPLNIYGTKVFAGDAEVGDILFGIDGSDVVITSIEEVYEQVPTYNLYVKPIPPPKNKGHLVDITQSSSTKRLPFFVDDIMVYPKLLNAENNLYLESNMCPEYDSISESLVDQNIGLPFAER